MNVFEYGASEQQRFNAATAENGYTAFTSFYKDLSIAEWVSGTNGVRKTFNEVVKSWGKNIRYFTEFVMSLNYKIWEFYQNNNPIFHRDGCKRYAELYNELWQKAEDIVFKNFKGQDLDYYYMMTD